MASSGRGLEKCILFIESLMDEELGLVLLVVKDLKV